VFGNTELELTVTPYALTTVLKNIGGMISLMFLFKAIAGCNHISQFNESLKKSYYRVTRMLTKENHYKAPVAQDPIEIELELRMSGFQNPENELSMSEDASFIEEMSKMSQP
jgi:hypothetical protein